MEPRAPTLLERLRRRSDLRLTAQRRVIAEALGGEHVHLTADEVLKRARRALPEVSVATVYNTLNELVALGEVRVVETGQGRVRYDPNADRPHDHLVCVSCGEIHDVYAQGRVRLPRAQQFGHRIVGRETVFRGYCPRCAARADLQRPLKAGRRLSMNARRPST
jgi:Fur family ferric uptake transcriptional regulator